MARTWWWTCPLCFDIMARTQWEGVAERDRDAHLRHKHGLDPEKTPYRTKPSFWDSKEYW